MEGRISHRHDDRHIEPELPSRTVAEAVHHIESALDLAERRGQALEQAVAGLGRRDAAGGAVEEAHAKRGLEPPHRLAQRRGRCAARLSRAAKAATATKASRSARLGAVIVRGSARTAWISRHYSTASKRLESRCCRRTVRNYGEKNLLRMYEEVMAGLAAHVFGALKRATGRVARTETIVPARFCPGASDAGSLMRRSVGGQDKPGHDALEP